MSAAFKSFCNEKGITIGYATPYMHKGNGIAEQYWKTLATIKDLLLIDSGLPVNFWAEAMIRQITCATDSQQDATALPLYRKRYGQTQGKTWVMYASLVVE